MWQLVRFSKLEKYRKFQDTLKRNPPHFTNVDPISLSALFEEHPTDYVYYGDSSALMFAQSQYVYFLICFGRRHRLVGRDID